MQSPFTIVKLNRVLKNVNKDYSISLRVYDIENRSFHNASMYIPKTQMPLLNFIHTLKKGDRILLTHYPSQNKKYASNLDVKHISRM